MLICRWNDVSEEIKKQLKNKMLFPIIGAGFSSNCQARRGFVPSGTELKDEMIRQIELSGGNGSQIKENNLKKVALYYKKLVEASVRKDYLLDHFTEIQLPEAQKKFLSIKWQYIYTFNIDTAIENNSEFTNIILPNKPIDMQVIEKQINCVFKVHGDAVEYCRYKNSSCYIFDFQEYAKSIKENHFLINKIENDFVYNNIIFIGCSLTDELDLLSLDFNDKMAPKVSRYYITTHKPDNYKQIDLELYGITHVVVVESYNQFYYDIYNLYLEAKKVQTDELDKFRNIKILHLPEEYEKNIDYLYLGKIAYDRKENHINLPSFFIDRQLVKDEIINEMDKYCIQCICGGRISGKTYALLSLVKEIKNRDVFYFDSRLSVNSETLNRLTMEKNCVICFDSFSLTKDQLYQLEKNIYCLKNNNINVVLCINRSEKDIISTIKSMESELIQIYDLKNKFTQEENDKLNKCFSIMSIPNFDYKKTILDNLLIVSKEINLNYKKEEYNFLVKSKDEMMVLILLAIQEKLTSQELVEFDIIKETYEIQKKIAPIIDEDYTDFIERNTVDSSSYKVYANSKYWIFNTLGSYASDKKNHSLIISAYKKIVQKLINNHSIRYTVIEGYIKYDIINEIFFKEKQGNLSLIKALYDELNDLLADNPQFHHQKAKCYLWHSGYSQNVMEEVNQALRFALVAHHNLSLKGNKNNDKVSIALSHIDFTIALIYAKKCSIENYSNSENFKQALKSIHQALQSQYNKEYCTNLIRRNEKKINDIKAFLIFAQTKDLSVYHLTSIERNLLNDLITKGYKFS